MLPGPRPAHAAALLGRHLRPGHGHLHRELILLAALAACGGKPEPFTPPPSPLPWGCAAETCTQRFPELPDDGEWECADVDGVVVCRGGGPAAGVSPGPAAAGWACGERRGQAGERICVDVAPDTPDGASAGWRCHHTHTPEQRVCRRDPTVAARPAPAPPRPACWLDGDCDGASCVAGSCR